MIPPGYHGLGVISWGATIRHSWVFTLDIDFFLWPVDEKNFSTMITWVGDEFSELVGYEPKEGKFTEHQIVCVETPAFIFLC